MFRLIYVAEILAVLFMFCVVTAIDAVASPVALPIVKVIDGDTIKTKLPSLPDTISDVSIRIVGIDTPEKNPRAKCLAEHVRGVKASDFVKSLAKNNKDMLVDNMKWDKYGGRIDGTVIIGGVDVAKELINQGLARPYNGGKKGDWCSGN